MDFGPMHFLDTKIWKMSVVIAKQVNGLLSLLPGDQRFGMCSQLSRAVISVSSNIAEGWGRETDRDKRRFMVVAQGSLYEVQCQLILCVEFGWLQQTQVVEVLEHVDHLSRMLTKLRIRLSRDAEESCRHGRIGD